MKIWGARVPVKWSARDSTAWLRRFALGRWVPCFALRRPVWPATDETGITSSSYVVWFALSSSIRMASTIQAFSMIGSCLASIDLIPVYGVNLLRFAQKCPEIEDSSQSCLHQSLDSPKSVLSPPAVLAFERGEGFYLFRLR